MSIKLGELITNIHDEYTIKWFETIPEIVDGLNKRIDMPNEIPIFSISNKKEKVEIESNDSAEIERIAKAMTNPVGKSKITSDIVYIHIRTGYESFPFYRLVGLVLNTRTKMSVSDDAPAD